MTISDNPLVAVATITFRRGGLDVNWAGLQKQTYKNWLWLIGDELHSDRVTVIPKSKQIIHFPPPQKREGFHRNLAAAYNQAMVIARYHGAEIFVSMQDYMWIPDDGLEKFVNVIKEYNCLVTGLTSLTADPDPETEVYDKEGLWTIFKEPYKTTDRPKTIAWSDVRANMHPWGQLDQCIFEHFEANWCAWPLEATEGIEFDEAFDEHVAYENQDFALQCSKKGIDIVIDTTNHALGLPHKKYFPQDEIIDGPHCKYNKELLDRKWNL